MRRRVVEAPVEFVLRLGRAVNGGEKRSPRHIRPGPHREHVVLWWCVSKVVDAPEAARSAAARSGPSLTTTGRGATGGRGRSQSSHQDGALLSECEIGKHFRRILLKWGGTPPPPPPISWTSGRGTRDVRLAPSGGGGGGGGEGKNL